LKVAIVHDWLDAWRGGERVLAEILAIYPDADLFALVDFLEGTDRKALGGRRARTTFLQRMPLARKHFRLMLPLFPRAVESLDVAAYDLVISSSHAVAKGVRTRAGQVHVCYCYTPMRYAWDLRDQYLERTGLGRGLRGVAVRRLLARLRAWDRAAGERVDHFIAISNYIASRIRTCYGRESTVIYPPVAVPPTLSGNPRDDLYVTVSQLVPYKRVDLIVDAFRATPDRRLTIIGEGPERVRLTRDAPANVTFVGRIADDERDRLLASARAFVFAAEEDFGIAPLEAQAFGTPVIAYARGGTGETIVDLDRKNPTGVLFAEQSARSIAEAVRRFEASQARIRPEACRENALRFAPEKFRAAFAQFIATHASAKVR